MSTNSNDTFLQKFLLQEHLGVEYLKTQKWSVNSKWFRFWIGVYMYLKFFIISDKTKYILVVYIHFLKPTFTGCHGFWKKSHCISLKLNANVLKFRQRNSLLKSGITVFLIRELYNSCSETKTVSNESSVSKHIIVFCISAFSFNEKRKKGFFFLSYQFSCLRY